VTKIKKPFGAIARTAYRSSVLLLCETTAHPPQWPPNRGELYALPAEKDTPSFGWSLSRKQLWRWVYIHRGMCRSDKGGRFSDWTLSMPVT